MDHSEVTVIEHKSKEIEERKSLIDKLQRDLRDVFGKYKRSACLGVSEHEREGEGEAIIASIR